MSNFGGPDVWKVSADDRSKHDQQFFALKPVNGLISGEQARGYFLQSGLPSNVLAQVWGLADINKDGKMDKKEFSIAVHLIKKKLEGFTLPATLPDTMKADPQPVIGTFGVGPVFQQQPVPPPGVWQGQMPQYMVGAGGVVAGQPPMAPYGQMAPIGATPSPVPTARPPSSAKTDWSMNQHAKLKYSQNFNNIDKNRTGFLTGVHARNILSQFGLPNNLLAQIWSFSDVDKDGRLSCDEYCLAMHLIDMVKAGATLPVVLPYEATAFMRQRTASIDGVGGIGAVRTDSPSFDEQQRYAVSFEDKRKENFDRGQAELDRRRQILFEQEKRERDERERKDREEFERRERERIEMDRRRQLEIEKMMAKQREEQQKQEEEYRKVIEQREAARRELEKQRQVEMERQRLHELILQRQHEQESVCHLKQKEKNLNFQLQALNEKSTDLNNMITEVREKVVGVTSSIEGMKHERDTKLVDIESSKRQIQELQMQMGHLVREKQTLNDRRMQISGGGSGADAINDSYRQVMHTYRNKSLNLESLRNSLTEVERDLEMRQAASKQRQQTWDDLQAELQREKSENEQLKQSVLECQQSASKLLPQKASTNVSSHQAWAANNDTSAWPSVADTAWAMTSSSTVNGQSTANGGDVNTMKYRAVFEFAARSEDELSFQPGDIILVFRDHVGEPGWLAGQIKDKVGWFPEAFAELYDAQHAMVESPSQQLSAPKILESINEESFEKDDQQQRSHHPHHPASSRATSTTKQTAVVEEPKRAVAQFPYKGKKDDHLSFNKGDVIQVTKTQEMWWCGELDGKTGWFPKSYVKLTESGERRKSETTTGATLPTKLRPNNSVSQEFPPQAPPGESGSWYVANYPFPKMEDGDLAFESGDRIFVTQQEGEWWTGRCKGFEGMFPANYVVPADDTGDGAVVASMSNSVEKPTELSTTGGVVETLKKSVDRTPSIETPGTKQPSVELTTPSGDEEYEIGKAIAPYKALESNQLTLETGDLIKIRSKSPQGWWEGELQKRGQEKKIGWFPGEYVKILSKRQDSLGSLKKAGSDAADDKRETVMAMFDYPAQQDDELSLNRGDIIVVLEKVDADWWKGEMTSGQRGLFPANYVQPYEGVTSPKDEQQRENAKEATPNGFEPAAPSTPTDGNNKQNFTKRQLSCQELAHTEQNYLDDLHMVKEVFYKQIGSSQTLTQDELRTIFVNWDELSRVSKDFLKSLRRHGEDGVGRAVLDCLANFRALVKFCQFQQTSLELLDSKLKSSVNFQSVHSHCCQHPAARGLPLSHFLLIPMTRITKYPLVLKEILKYTTDDHADRENLHNALTALKELCDEVNRVASETDNLQMLYWCQNHVKCDSLQPKFVFHSSTNFLGPRKFVHFGVLFKAKSNRLLIGLLFNDVLMLTTPDEAIDHPDSFKLTRTSELVLSLYKQPILLHKSSLQMPPSLTGVDSGDDTVFALHNGEMLISFKAVSSNGRLLWTKQLEKAIKNVKIEHSKWTTVCSSTKPISHKGIGRLLMEVVFLRNLNVPSDCKSLPISVELSFGEQKSWTKNVDLSKTETASSASLCTTQFVIVDDASKQTGVFCMSVFVERPYAPNLLLGKATLSLLDMMKMSGHQRNPAMKQLPLLDGETADALDGGGQLPPATGGQQVIVKFVVQMFDDR